MFDTSKHYFTDINTLLFDFEYDRLCSHITLLADIMHGSKDNLQFSFTAEVDSGASTTFA